MIERSRTERTLSGATLGTGCGCGTLTRAAQARVEDVLERRREPDERQLEERDREDRAEDVPEAVAEKERAPDVREVQHEAPVTSGEREQAEKRESGDAVDRRRHREDEVDGDVAAHVRQDLFEDDVEEAEVEGPRGLDVVALL